MRGAFNVEEIRTYFQFNALVVVVVDWENLSRHLMLANFDNNCNQYYKLNNFAFGGEFFLYILHLGG